MNPLTVVLLLLRHLEAEHHAIAAPTREEEDFAMALKGVLVQAAEYGYTYTEKVEDLVAEGFDVQPEGVYDPEAEDPEYQADPSHNGATSDPVSLDYKKSAVGYWKSKQDGSLRKFSQVQNKFRSVTQLPLLYRWEKQIQAGGTHRDKLKEISRATYEKFMELKRGYQKVNTLDIRRIALLKAREINCTNFKASESWAKLFKAKHRIVSRKITKFVSKKDIVDKEIIKDRALDFVLQAVDVFESHNMDHIVNTDQSGFEMELHSGRTLDVKGVKKVEVIAQSKSALTHSYTIMPTITASGKLLEPLYMVLREDNGVFGPRVSETMFRPPNVFLSASQSGKMGKKHLDEYMQNVAVPNLAPRGVLMVDSWSAFSDENIMKNIPRDMELDIRQIPEGATGMVQPLDVYGFRIWKNYVKHITQFVIVNDIDFPFRQRDNITKLQSLVYRQLGSPRFTGLFKYSWYKSGYVTERPEYFPNPVKFCFHGEEILCSCCPNLRLLTCSWCKKSLCVFHFLVDYHLCNTFVA